ncbi:MAG: hypothetical protein ABWZ40_14090 [Caulobacterales bacterium]
MSNKVEITPPNFALQRKVGAPVKQTPLSMLAAADKALAQQADAFDAYFQSVLRRWRGAEELSPAQVYQDAHDVRGMAGSFQRADLGRIADALCAYIDAANNAKITPDPDALKALRDALTACAHLEVSEPAAAAQISARACEAVQKRIAGIAKG